IVLAGVSFMAKITSDAQFEDFTISSLIVGFIGTVEGVRSVIISNIRKIDTNFIFKISIYSLKIIIVPIIFFMAMFYLKFGINFSLIFLLSTLCYFVAVINLSLLEGKGFVGFGALSRTGSWAFFYLSSISFVMMDISLIWSILSFSISFLLLCTILC
ncbi:hypothetical protein, partial [Vibrio sinaloensis]|uniref:hypothetical protein n=1 Tax=Photobacterium sp. (strain ATCC 43367) TaxID=379097 RepID=UPI000587C71F